METLVVSAVLACGVVGAAGFVQTPRRAAPTDTAPFSCCGFPQVPGRNRSSTAFSKPVTSAANVVQDSEDNVYGCAQGGAHPQGGIFHLASPAQQGAAWTETVLYTFGVAPMDPVAVLGSANEGCGIAIDPATGSSTEPAMAGVAQDTAPSIALLRPLPDRQPGPRPSSIPWPIGTTTGNTPSLRR